MTQEEYIDSKVTTMTDLSGKKSKVLLLKNETEIESFKKQLALCNVVDTLPADVLIKSLGEAKEPNEYILKTHNGVWWLEHKHVGSAEPLKQWLTDKAVSG